MIVRINQIDSSQAERESGWLSSGALGPILGAPWPQEMRTFELLILEQDEQQRQLPETFRQTQIRHMIPEAAAALRERGEELIARLDGPLAEGELIPAFRRLTDAGGIGRFAFSPGQKMQANSQTVMGSIRLAPTFKSLAGLCADTTLGIERSVRLRVMAAGDPLVGPLLETFSLDDPAWGQILSQVAFLICPTRGLRSIHIHTRRFDTAAVKSRIMQRLMSGVAAGEE